MIFGTDVGYMHDYDTTEEYELMAQAGMTAQQILASLTTAPAERFGDSQREGRIAASFGADLVVLDKDPSADVRAFAAVRYTIRDGKVIYKASTNLARADEGLTARNKAAVVNGILLRSLAFNDPERLVAVLDSKPSSRVDCTSFLRIGSRSGYGKTRPLIKWRLPKAASSNWRAESRFCCKWMC